MNGLLLIRSKSNSKIDALVKAENLDRQSLFKHLAKQTGGDVNIVAKKFAKGIAARAKKGIGLKFFRKLGFQVKAYLNLIVCLVACSMLSCSLGLVQNQDSKKDISFRKFRG